MAGLAVLFRAHCASGCQLPYRLRLQKRFEYRASTVCALCFKRHGSSYSNGQHWSSRVKGLEALRSLLKSVYTSICVESNRAWRQYLSLLFWSSDISHDFDDCSLNFDLTKFYCSCIGIQVTTNLMIPPWDQLLYRKLPMQHGFHGSLPQAWK